MYVYLCNASCWVIIHGWLLWENYMHDYVVIGMIVMSLFNVVYECVIVVNCGLVHVVH